MTIGQFLVVAWLLVVVVCVLAWLFLPWTRKLSMNIPAWTGKTWKAWQMPTLDDVITVSDPRKGVITGFTYADRLHPGDAILVPPVRGQVDLYLVRDIKYYDFPQSFFVGQVVPAQVKHDHGVKQVVAR